jgi:hypothetical protein
MARVWGAAVGKVLPWGWGRLGLEEIELCLAPYLSLSVK